MDRSSNIFPLNETNFSTWKTQIRMLLMRDNLLGIVEGTEIAPSQTGENTAQFNKFLERRNRALAQIVLHISPNLLYIIGDPTDPVIVWKKLQDVFQRKTWANNLRLRKRLYSMKLMPGDDLQAHLKIFIELFDDLAVIGDAIEEEDRVINLLASLPESYGTLVTALEASDKVPTWEAVTERLLHEESKHKGNAVADASVEEKVLFTRNKSHRKPPKCFECGKIGHVRKNCYALMDKNKPRNSMSVANMADKSKNVNLLVSVCQLCQAQLKMVLLLLTLEPASTCATIRIYLKTFKI